MMRSPAFWYQPPSWRARLLAPLGWLYGQATAWRLARGARAVMDVPVICVGNLTAGGSGKTPVTIALAAILAEMGKTPHIISRGYGGRMRGPVSVDPVIHRAADCGDEPLLLSAFAPVWVARDRAQAARAAIAGGADVLVLDDGFQNPSLAYDLSLIVVDAALGFGNGALIPAGPLREPVAVGLARADHVISIGNETAQAAFARDWGGQIAVPQSRAHLAPLPTGLPLAGRRVVAFAGIAHPARFFATLRAQGAEVIHGEALGDHAPISDALFQRLARMARAHDAQLITTEKDAVRLPPSLRGEVQTLPVRLVFEDQASLTKALAALF